MPKDDDRRIAIQTQAGEKINVKIKDYLVSVPLFQALDEQQLKILEDNATIEHFNENDIITYQGERGHVFYIIHQGKCEVWMHRNSFVVPALRYHKSNDEKHDDDDDDDDDDSEKKDVNESELGTLVNVIGEGKFFGEQALLTTKPRNATIRARTKVCCISFNKTIFGMVLSTFAALVGDHQENDWRTNEELRILTQHISTFNRVKSIDGPDGELLRKLIASYSPEMDTEDIIENVCNISKQLLRADRVSLFNVDPLGRNLIMKVSKDSGIIIPVTGIAGFVLMTGEAVNIANAHTDERFNPAIDLSTGYRTRQILCVPILDPVTRAVIGGLQANNYLDDLEGVRPFPEEFITYAKLIAEELAELTNKRRLELEFPSFALFNDQEQEAVFKALYAMKGENFKLKILKYIPRSSLLQKPHKIHIKLELYHGGELLCPVQYTSLALAETKTETEFNCEVEFPFQICNIPRATRLLVSVETHSEKKALSWGGCHLFDFSGFLLRGEAQIKLFFGHYSNPRTVTIQNNYGKEKCDQIFLSVTDYGYPIIALRPVDICRTETFELERVTSYLFSDDKDDFNNHQNFCEGDEKEMDLIQLEHMVANPLVILTPSDKKRVWDMRFDLILRPHMLVPFLLSVDWGDSVHVQEAYKLLKIWEPLSHLQALQLLDRRFPDPKVRAFAVHWLSSINDEDLALYMLQLTQQLKFEQFHDSALARFLLRRALINPNIVGHIFWWLLKAEMHIPDVMSRFGMYLDLYLSFCEEHRLYLGHQLFVMNKLKDIAFKVKETPSAEERLHMLQKELQETIFPEEFQLPLNPHLVVKSVVFEKCRVMESKKKPLWLVFEDAKEKDKLITVMFKAGDDLRQDQLTLQVMKVMEGLWKNHGLDPKMSIYSCISTGQELGMLEVVPYAKTIGKIIALSSEKAQFKFQRKLASAITAISGHRVILNWLEEQTRNEVKTYFEQHSEAKKLSNSIDLFEKMLKIRTENFALSCASYCVATYVIGIGDRHNDNIMMTESGNFFHIDFGHFLGNFKSKFGVKRERAPFVFTPHFAKVLGPPGSELFEEFVRFSCQLFNILRHNGMLLISLFALMLPCGMPELQSEDDVHWLYDHLCLDMTDEEAAQHFRRMIFVSLGTMTTMFNDAAHMLKHG